MPFPAAMSAPNLANIRGGYTGEAFLLATPQDIVFQAQVNGAVSGTYAQITYDTVSIGAFTDIVTGQTVIVHSDVNDLRDYKFKGRVRKTPTATLLYVNETSQALANDDFITVLNDLDVWERSARRAQDTNFVDYDLAFQKLAPNIKGLASVVAVNSGSAASIAFAPTVTAMESGASISSYLWDVGDGTITVGTTTTKDITVSFPAYSSGPTSGWRWVHFTATDSNGVSHTFHFEVYVGDFHSAEWSVRDFDSASWSANWERGYNGSLTLFADNGALLDDTRVALVFLDSYGGVAGSIYSNVQLIGRLRREAGDTRGDDTDAVLQETRFEIVGLGAQLADLPLRDFAMEDDATPTAWEEIDTPTVPRCCWHVLTRYTTYATVCCVDFDTVNDNAYSAGILSTQADTPLDAMNRMGARINARMTFAPDGECRVRRDANYLSTSDRSALTTIAGLTTADALAISGPRREHRQRIGFVEAAGLVYNTTQHHYTFYQSKSPTIANTSGQEVATLDGQILTANSNASDATMELGQRAANHLASLQPADELPADLIDGLRELVPSNHDWFTWTLLASDNTRGIAYTTATRWLLTDLSGQYEAERQLVNLSATFRKETSSTGAAVLTTIIPEVITPTLPTNPIQPPYGGYLTYDPDTFNTSDDPAEEETSVIPPEAFNPDTPTDDNPPLPESGCENLLVPFFNGTGKATSFNSVMGQDYECRVVGFMTGAGSQVTEFDWDVSPLEWSGPVGWSLAHDGSFGDGPANFDGYYKYTGGASVQLTTFVMTFTIPSEFVSTFQFHARRNHTGGTGSVRVQAGTIDETRDLPESGTGSATFTYDINETISSLILTITANQKFSGVASDFFEFQYGTGGDKDAFYAIDTSGSATVHGASDGIHLDGVKLTPAPPFHPAHLYYFIVAGTGSPLAFTFEDSGGYGDNSQDVMILTVCGPGA